MSDVTDLLEKLEPDYKEYDDELYTEILQDKGVIVHMGSLDQHRWYIVQPVVYSIKDKFVQFYRYITTGDGDQDLEYDIDDAHFVKREEDTDTHYYYA